jgi:hypothetical protein
MRILWVRGSEQIHLATAALALIRRPIVHDQQRLLIWLLELRLHPQAPQRRRHSNGRRHGGKDKRNNSEHAGQNN